ncbi:MAG: hypothetical protein U9R31_02260, partial [Candidatus Omnitrophota bacterium]|nr:hypothetical protein [Candidatus Omnitrophota bacterium]
MRQQPFFNKKFKIIFPAFLILVPALLITLSSNSNAKFNEVYLIKINDDTINPVTADYIINSIDKAGQVNAECLIIELDTPGGLLSSTRLIVKKISQAKIPVVVYVYPAGSRAGSAGVFITYASHIAAMAPATNIGAAHPVKMGGGGRSLWDALRDLIDSFSNQEKQTRQKESSESDVMADKVLQDSLAFIRALAEERNRNSSWAEKSVVESASITAEEARKIGVIEIIAKDELELLRQLNERTVKIGGKTKTLNTRGAVINYITMTPRERILNVLANPNIAYILMILGFYGLFFEITHPGIGFPGIAGTICLILAFF